MLGGFAAYQEELETKLGKLWKNAWNISEHVKINKTSITFNIRQKK